MNPDRDVTRGHRLFATMLHEPPGVARELMNGRLYGYQWYERGRDVQILMLSPDGCDDGCRSQ